MVLTPVSSLASLCDMLNADQGMLSGYFGGWYQKHQHNFNSIKACRTLLFSSWYFDEPKALLAATRFLAYNYAGHITEHNPTKLYRWHLPQRLIRKFGQPQSSIWVKSLIAFRTAQRCAWQAQGASGQRALEATQRTSERQLSLLQTNLLGILQVTD